MEEFQRWGRARLAGLLVTVAALLLPASASAADSIYWSREDFPESIRVGNLDGSVSTTPPISPRTLFGDGGAPCGVALDPAAGKIYWANFGGGEIQVANLDGSGTATPLITGQDNPCGVTVDPAAGRIYWAEFCEVPGQTCGTIRGADLADVSGTDETLVTGEAGPSGVTLDPAAGKIYWTNQSPAGTPPGSVRGADLADPQNTATTVVANQANPIGVAVASGKIYWTNLASGEVRAANLANPEGTATTLFNVTTFGPSGPAIDPTASPPKIYWAGWQSGAGIRSGNLNPIGGPTPLFSGEGNSLFTAVLKKPVNTGRPNISGGAKTGKEMTCENGTWAADLLGAFLYRAPASFGAYQWQRNGSPIATGPTFEPNLAGDYTCTLTATNEAGSTPSQTSSVKKVKAK